jgi:hypothetical protein
MAPKNRRVTITPSTHRLSVGPLKAPLGTFTAEQLESARELVDAALTKAEEAGDETTAKRLQKDAVEVKAELERRDLSAA